MLKQACFSASLLLISLPAIAATSAEVENQELENAASVIKALIGQLGSDEFRQRETASRQLEEIGEPALPWLRSAMNTRSTPTEVRIRATALVEKIMHTACHSKSTDIRFVYLDRGKFTMGSPEKEAGRKENEQQHEVELSQPVLIAAFEVTQGEFQSVMGYQPAWFSRSGEGSEAVKNDDTDTLPVESVTWFDAIEFCNQLSKKDGLKPYYEITDVKRSGKQIESANVKVLGGIGYRLPTEAEWEYACRAGTDAPFQFGTGKPKGGNYSYRTVGAYGTRGSTVSKGKPISVGSYSPNLWDLSDMHGNVAEWCWDWYDSAMYEKSPAKDPAGPETGDHRILRGGSWLVDQSSCRAAARFWQAPGQAKYFAGFRVARTPSEYMIPATTD